MAALIKTHVLLFAGLRDRLNRNEIDLKVPEGTKAKEILMMLLEDPVEADKLARCTLFAINQNYINPETPLKEGDELVLIPPVAGG